MDRSAINSERPQLHLRRPYSFTEVCDELGNLSRTDLKIIRQLGKGTFGRVDLVEVHGNPSRRYALKTIPIIGLTAEDFQDLQRERAILARCSSNFVVRLYRTFEGSESHAFLMELCQGGDLFTLLESRQFFGEECSRFYVGCVIEAIQYLHARHITHRDLKPLNMMLDRRGYVKLIDFGFSADLSRDPPTGMICGTPQYMAPEMLHSDQACDHSVDYWSLGVTMFQLVGGTFPFDPINIWADEVPMETVLRERQNITFYPSAVSWTMAGVHLVRNLLATDPADRIGYRRGIDELKSHRWFRNFDWESLQARIMEPPFHPNL